MNKGDVFGNLLCVSDVYYKEIGKTKKKRKYIKVKCLNCDNDEILEANVLSLTKGKTGLCKHCRKIGNRVNGNPNNTNRYEIYNDISYIYTSKDEVIIIDTSMLDELRKYTWCISKTGYAITQIDKKKVFMHRLIFELLGIDLLDMLVDHKNRNRIDNRINNLNLVTHNENNENTSLYSNNTSGYRGISITNEGKYLAYITKNNKNYRKTFDSLNEAINWRKNMESELFLYMKDVQKTLEKNEIVLYED